MIQIKAKFCQLEQKRPEKLLCLPGVIMGSTKQLFAAICMTANLMGGSACAVAAPSPRTILIIDHSNRDSLLGRHFREQFHSTLDTETKQPYVVYTEYLDLAHFAGPKHETILRSYFRERYADKPISLIVAVGTGTVNFLSHAHVDIWRSAPLVFATFDGASTIGRRLTLNATGVVAKRQFQNLVKAARLLVPDLATLSVVGEAPGRQPFRHEYQQQIQQLNGSVRVMDMRGLPLDKVKTKVATLPNDAAAAYPPIYSDQIGTIHNPSEALKALAKVTNRPIVTDSTSFIGKGATGGFVVSAKDLGREVARRVARILGGETASHIPIAVDDMTRPVFDARELVRWGISDTALPANSEVRFRRPGVWKLYHWQIIAALVVILTQGLIIARLLFERRRRVDAQRESRQHLLEMTKMDRALTAGAMSSSIAHELNQPLSAILNNAEAAEMLLGTDSPDQDQLKNILADIRRDDKRAADIIKHLRTLLKKSNLDLQDIDLPELINETVGLLRPQAAERDVTIQVAPIPAHLRVRGDCVHIQQVLLNLAVNAIDAMQNVPSTERVLRLQAKRRSREAVALVADTGWGIPVDKLKNIFQPFVTTKQEGTDLGLSIAQTIIAAHGGAIWAENGAKSGATFCFSLRLAPAKRARRIRTASATH